MQANLNPTHHGSRLLALAVTISLAACGGGDQATADVAQAEDPNISTASPREALTEVDYGDLDASEIGLALTWTRNSVSRDHDSMKGPARLTGVSTVRENGFDRVVFAFEPHVPGYEIAFVEGTGGGCDGSQALDGEGAYLSVNLGLARANEDGRPLVGDRNRRLGFPSLNTAAQTCDEEFKVNWLLGQAGEAQDFRVFEMRGEPRLVVDLLHPAG